MASAVAACRLEQLIGQERMTARDLDDPPPHLPDGARVTVMSADGEVSSRWEWPDAVRWWEAAAWRAEDQFGNPVGPVVREWRDFY